MSENNLQHIAIIMDGNGRWAKKRGLPRTAGHKAGEKAVKEVIENCYNKGIPYLSLFAFSTENWKRDSEEVKTLFTILAEFMKRFQKLAISKEIRIHIMGDITCLDGDLQKSLINIMEETKDFTKLTVNIGVNYGGRAEMVRAINLARESKEEVTEGNITKYLYTSEIPDPDIVVRTSGEYRFSNFMIYQCAYSELYFTDVLWPDFGEEELDKVIESFKGRNRRFGKA